MASGVLTLWKERGEPEPSGREAELAMLLREQEDAKSSDRARFVFVKGPLGVGKSHLFGLLRSAAAKKGVAVFEGGSGREARRTFGLFSPVVAELLTALSQEGVPSARLAELARSLQPLTQSTSKDVMENRRVELYDALCELFALAGRSAPVFLFPDLDAQDRGSLDLFRYLAAVATTPGARSGGLFVASLRDDGALPEVLVEVLSKVPSRSLPLAGLDVDGIRAYLSRQDVAQRLLEATGGNPEALNALLDRPHAPPQAVDFFLKRSERLSPQERDVLDALSVCADALPLAALRHALHVGVASEVDSLVRGRFLVARVVEGQPVYRFARESEREAWVESLGSRRASIQRKVALSLEASGERISAATLLWAVSNDAQAVELAVRAADELSSRGAHEDAADFYERALGHLSGAPRAQVLERHAAVLGALGRFRGAVRALLSAHAVAPKPANVLLAARHLLRMGHLRLVEPTLRVPLAHPATRFEAESVRAELHMLRGNLGRALEHCQKVLAEQGVPDQAVIWLRNIMGRTLLLRGDAAQAGELFAENAALAESLGLSELASQARLNRGVAAHKLGDRETATASYQAAQAGLARHLALANLGSLYAESGDFELALDCLTRAVQVMTRLSGPKETAQQASNLSRLHHFLGDLERADELSEHALALAQRLSDSYLEASALLNLGAVAIDRKDMAEAVRHLDVARQKFEALGNDGYAALAAAQKARAHLNAGERAQAEAELNRRCVDRGAQSMAAAAIEVELTRGDLAVQLGDLHGAARAVARAKDALLQSPELEGPSRVHLLSARMKLAAHDSAGAQGELARAWRMLEELVSRVPPVRRTAFLSVPRRAELLAAVEPELKLPKSVAAPMLAAEKKLGLVGRGAALQRIVKQLEPIGRSNTTVLVRGESGTGKELLADALHQLSPRRSMPLVKVNCAAMVEELLLSELFGHEKGAFTGAIRERKGRFELADGGTLFLDEIGDISPKCQVALLRVLQERELERVGGTKTIKVDVRVICATNRDLETLIAQGRFRADLYYRLKGVMLELPPLRERLEDLSQLSAHFLERVARERHENVKRLSESALALLTRHSWPGNVRELENVLSAAAIFAEGEVIQPEAFSHVAELRALNQPATGETPVQVSAPAPQPVAVPSTPAPVVASPVGAAAAVVPISTSGPTAEPEGTIDYFELARARGISLKDLRREVELQCIRRALLEAGGNISEAARLLKMKRSRLSQIVNAEGELKEVAHGDDE